GHLRHLPTPDGCRGDDQPAAARRAHGLCPLAGRNLDRAAAARTGKGAGRAVAVHAEYRFLVAGPGFPTPPGAGIWAEWYAEQRGWHEGSSEGTGATARDCPAGRRPETDRRPTRARQADGARADQGLSRCRIVRG